MSIDVVIIGGGAIGCSIAYFLSGAGASVLLLERDGIGSHASQAAAGLLAPLGPLPQPGPFADLLLAGYALFPTLVPRLEAATGLELDYQLTGALRVGLHTRSSERLRVRQKDWRSVGWRADWLTSEQARQQEPLLGSGVRGAVSIPDEGQIHPEKLTRAFAQAAQQQGATLRTGCEIVGTQEGKNRIEAIVTAQGERITCSEVVLATGSWSGIWADRFRLKLPIGPQRGQLVTIEQPQGLKLQRMIFGNGLYVVPRPDNTVLIGATKSDEGFNTTVRESETLEMVTSAARLLPFVQEARLVKAWTGLRPHTPDLRPILGRAQGWDNLTIASGHNSLGILLSGITGQCISRLLLEGQMSGLKAFEPQSQP